MLAQWQAFQNPARGLVRRPPLTASQQSVRLLILIVATSLVVPYMSPVTPSLASAQKAEPHRQFNSEPAGTVTLPGGKINAFVGSCRGSRQSCAVTDQGLTLSAYAGVSWQNVLVGGTSDEVFALAPHPSNASTLYVGRRDGLWISRDGGQTWAPLGPPVSPPYVPLAIAPSPSQPDVIYIGAARHGVLRSADGGTTWTPLNQGLPLGADGQRVVPIKGVVLHPHDPKVAYVATELHGIFKTEDEGKSWRAINRGLPIPPAHRTYAPHLVISPENPDTLVAAIGYPVHSHLIRNLLYQSLDGGGSWTQLDVALPENVRVLSLELDRASTGTLYLWTEDRILQIREAPVAAKSGR